MRLLLMTCILLIAIDFGLMLAHALELPGKLRLDEATYKAVQAIYYPGFTIGGFVGEFGGIVALALLVFLTPYGSHRFWWAMAALLFIVASHATYWIVTHPVNNFWIKDVAMGQSGSAFFSAFAGGQAGTWTELRSRWEASHVIRLGFTTLALLSITALATMTDREA